MNETISYVLCDFIHKRFLNCYFVNEYTKQVSWIQNCLKIEVIVAFGIQITKAAFGCAYVIVFSLPNGI